MKTYFYDTEIGKIGIGVKEDKVAAVFFPCDTLPAGAVTEETDLHREAAGQLRDYLAGKRRDFTLPLVPEGTPFMQEAWRALCQVPFGQTATYKEIAQKVGRPKACRAVGLANNRNPIPVFIPCHRIVGSDGSLTGYRGGLEMKRKLLALEGIHIKG